ncbi:hypothetical protein [Vibrio harveyi]|uniref:hypothetical protein n=1 Tax=Vibrio harveyi TaxID=669 RepID=UPI003CF15D9E
MKKILLKWQLPKLVQKSCESRIPRSGEEGKKVNCFVVAIDKDSSPFFVATEYQNGRVKGLKWTDGSYSQEHEFTLDELCNEKIRITHYFGLTEIFFSNIYDYCFNHVSRFVYLKVRARNYLESAHQYFFNKRKLVTKKRMELLKFMMNDQLDREYGSISVLDLMTKLYTINWVLHPSADEQQSKLQLYLDSLVESGDLTEYNNIDYTVTGKALITLERYEEEERRHTEAVKLQKKMVYLTVLLAIVAIVQSGLVKLPVFLDFTTP